jgi:hypothetical protein
MVREPLRYYSDETDPPPWMKALAEVRRLATREGWCYHHVQAIIVSIDQYAEAALGNREFFLNEPYSITAVEGTTTSRRREQVFSSWIASPGP